MLPSRVHGIVKRREFYLVTTTLLFLGLIYQLDVLTKLPEVTNDSTASGDSARFKFKPGLSTWSKKGTEKQRPTSYPLVQTSVEDRRVIWGDGVPPQTTLLGHDPGWTLLDNVYMYNGTLFIVTENPEQFPERRMMISTGYPVYNGEVEVNKREPSDADLQVISVHKAKQLFGAAAYRVDGASAVITEPTQFISHYYHFCAELMVGFWRAYTSLDPGAATGRYTIPPPRRFIFPHLKSNEWRDYAKMDQFVFHAAFPGAGMEFEQDWQDRAEALQPWIFDRVILGDRSASMRGKPFLATQRFAASAFNLPGAAGWWAPIRNAVVEFVGLDKSVGSSTMENPVITYISRQTWGRRMLKPEDHESLVKALKRLEAEKGYEVNIVSMDKLTREEQLRLAARTTIMMGVHGNGLTALLWMNPTPRATVMEFFYPGGFTFDYEWTARAVGVKHFGFWGSSHFTSPDLPPVAYPKGFQGNEIPLDGQAVADLIVQRLSLLEEADD